jgi:hypothetical protein
MSTILNSALADGYPEDSGTRPRVSIRRHNTDVVSKETAARNPKFSTQRGAAPYLAGVAISGAAVLG